MLSLIHLFSNQTTEVLKLKKLDDLEVNIVKMKESSGNVQFFIRLVRKDVSDGFCLEGYLEHTCWQTKNLTKEECLSRAWFDASYLARFIGLETMDEVKLINMTNEEKKFIKNCLSRI